MQVFAGQGQSTGEGKKSGASRVAALGMGGLLVGLAGVLALIM